MDFEPYSHIYIKHVGTFAETNFYYGVLYSFALWDCALLWKWILEVVYKILTDQTASI